MSMNGIDISRYQKGLDLRKVPCDFVIVKATEGTYMVQDTCDPWIQQAKSLGKKWGFYHFAGGGNAIAEADYFVKHTRGYFGHGIPILDYEMYGRKGTAWVKAFLNRVYEQTKVRCMVYTSRSVLVEEDWSAIAPKHALWVAQYADFKPTGYQNKPWFPKGSIGAFKFVTIHQYSSSGRLAGWSGNLDINIAYLTADGWDAIAKGDIAVPKPQKPKPKPQAPADSTLKLVADTLAGKYGNGNTRKQKLGSRYTEVQNMINHISTASKDTLAREVIKGKYGNGAQRKAVLGKRFMEVQRAVNRMM